MTAADCCTIITAYCSMSVSASESRYYCAISDDGDANGGADGDGSRRMNSDGDVADGGYCTVASDSFRSFGWERVSHG